MKLFDYIDEINATKIKLGLPLDPFYLPEEVILHFRANYKILQEAVQKWDHELLISRTNKNLDRFWSILGAQIGPSSMQRQRRFDVSVRLRF